METPKVGKILLQLPDGLYYPQAVFDSMLNQVMGAIIRRIIHVKKSPQSVMKAVNKLQSKRVRKVVYQEAFTMTQKSVPGIKAEDVDESFTLLPMKKEGKSA